MESLIVGGLLMTVGVVTLIRNVAMLRDEAKLVAYIETSPKAALWRNKLGVERTVGLARRVFLPVGSLVALALIGFGALQLVQR